jgi:hypothetical protein
MFPHISFKVVFHADNMRPAHFENFFAYTDLDESYCV